VGKAGPMMSRTREPSGLRTAPPKSVHTNIDAHKASFNGKLYDTSQTRHESACDVLLVQGKMEGAPGNRQLTRLGNLRYEHIGVDAMSAGLQGSSSSHDAHHRSRQQTTAPSSCKIFVVARTDANRHTDGFVQRGRASATRGSESTHVQHSADDDRHTVSDTRRALHGCAHVEPSNCLPISRLRPSGDAGTYGDGCDIRYNVFPVDPSETNERTMNGKPRSEFGQESGYDNGAAQRAENVATDCLDFESCHHSMQREMPPEALGREQAEEMSDNFQWYQNAQCRDAINLLERSIVVSLGKGAQGDLAHILEKRQNEVKPLHVKDAGLDKKANAQVTATI